MIKPLTFPLTRCARGGDEEMKKFWSRRKQIEEEVEINRGGYSEASFDIKEVYNNDGYDHSIIITGSIGTEMVRHLPELVQAARDAVNDPGPEKYKKLERWVKQYETGW